MARRIRTFAQTLQRQILPAMTSLLLLLSLFAFSGNAVAQSNLGGIGIGSLLGGDEEEILPPDVAFLIETSPAASSTNGSHGMDINWLIEDGYYLYRDQFNFRLLDADGVELEPGVASVNVTELSRGKMKEDAFFGTVEVNRNLATAALVMENRGAAREATLAVSYQGCADIGICFPPQTQQYPVSLSAADITDQAAVMSNTAASQTPEASGSSNSSTATASTGAGAGVAFEGLSQQDQLASKLGSSSLPIIVGLFFGFGLLLAFTPCVFPMIPILSGLIVGQSQADGQPITVKRSVVLSVVYVLAMALTYTIVGVLVGLSGENIQAYLQNPWILSAFAAILVLLSLSMFGFYELQMPVALQEKLSLMSNKQKGGTYTGAGVMGFLSALIVGPCVTAPLVGALIFIADTGDAFVGGLALFALSMGMGAPLILIGASCGKLMPRAGAWMNTVKSVFGVMMLGLAIWMLSRFVSPAITLVLSAVLLIVSGVYLGALDALAAGVSGWRKLFKGAGVMAVLYGVALFVGVLSGTNSFMHPLKGISGGGSLVAGNESHGELEFERIKSLDDLNGMIKTAGAQGQPLILDFYADWCVSCKEMEAFTFTDPTVMEQMSRAVLVQADVTKNDKIDKELLKEFSLFGPPAILFFTPEGEEFRNARVVGFMNKKDFSQHLERVYSETVVNNRTADAQRNSSLMSSAAAN